MSSKARRNQYKELSKMLVVYKIEEDQFPYLIQATHVSFGVVYILSAACRILSKDVEFQRPKTTFRLRFVISHVTSAQHGDHFIFTDALW